MEQNKVENKPENINNQGIGNDQMREVQIYYSNYLDSMWQYL